MSHAVDPIAPITLSNEPGSSVTFAVRVTGAVQPDATITGSVSVAFNGETVSTPLSVTVSGVVAPTATVALDGLDVVVEPPVQDSDEVWRFPVTITVV